MVKWVRARAVQNFCMGKRHWYYGKKEGMEKEGVKVKGTLPKSFRYGKTVKLPGTVTKKGYLFVGWNISDGYGGWQTLRSDSKGEIF